MNKIFRKARSGGDRVNSMSAGLFERHDIDVRGGGRMRLPVSISQSQE